MPARPSYYFTLFKKFQILGHAQSGISHGKETGPTGGFGLTNANLVFGSSNRGALLGATTNPADSPLWAVLNARAMGGPDPVFAGVRWFAMPIGSPPGWDEFQVNAPAPKLVEVFGNWIAAGKVNDIPDDVIATIPPAITAGLDSGVALFVCSMPGDNGVRPGSVPADYWATSLIFLVDAATGDTVFPSQLSASSDYYLAAVIGNCGDATGGRNANPPATAIEAAGWVMVWNSGTSPAVQLPALSHLDVNSTNGIYAVYELHPGQYEVVGFRLNVQTVFDGLVAAVAASGMDLGGLTPSEWVQAEGAHPCVRVLVKTEDESWPTLGDTPFTNRRLGQKNLSPISIDLAVDSYDPSIIWRNFVVGDVIKSMSDARRFDERLGTHTITIRPELPADVTRLYLAMPKRSFGRWFPRKGNEQFEFVSNDALGSVKPRFPDGVSLAIPVKGGSVEIPALGDEFLAMSLGIEYSPSRLKEGPLGQVTVVQQTAVPRIDKRKQSYEIEQVTVGGFTLIVEVIDPRPHYDT